MKRKEVAHNCKLSTGTALRWGQAALSITRFGWNEKYFLGQDFVWVVVTVLGVQPRATNSHC